MIPASLTDAGAMTMRVGGCVGNVARDLVALDMTVRIAACVGDDDLAPVLLAVLEREGLEIGQLRRVPLTGTSYSVVVEPPGMDRSFWHHVGANASFDGAALELDGATLLHLGYVTLLPRLYSDKGDVGLALLRTVKEAGVTTSLDTAVVDPRSSAGRVDWAALLALWLPWVDVFTPSLDDLVSMGLPAVSDNRSALAAGRWIVARGAGVALVTAGADGMALVTGSVERLGLGGRALSGQAAAWADREHWVAATDVTIVSTVGAGDAAAAGLLCGLLRGAAPDAALELAASCAAQSVSGATRLHRNPTTDPTDDEGGTTSDTGPTAARPAAGT